MRTKKHISIIFIIIIVFIFSVIIQIQITQKTQTININNIKKNIVAIVPNHSLIDANKNPKGLFNSNNPGGVGAGFLVRQNGEVITANHVVENETTQYNVFKDNIEYNTKVIYRNKEKDIAILKLENYTNTTNNIPINKTFLNLNAKIVSFGINPKNLEVIYNYGNILDMNKKLDNMSNLIKISNNIKPGFSGGPVFNMRGELIGINYAIQNNEIFILPSKFLE